MISQVVPDPLPSIHHRHVSHLRKVRVAETTLVTIVPPLPEDALQIYSLQGRTGVLLLGGRQWLVLCDKLNMERKRFLALHPLVGELWCLCKSKCPIKMADKLILCRLSLSVECTILLRKILLLLPVRRRVLNILWFVF